MTPVKVIYSGATNRETNGQMDERDPPSKRKNPECFYTRTIKAVYSKSFQAASASVFTQCICLSAFA